MNNNETRIIMKDLKAGKDLFEDKDILILNNEEDGLATSPSYHYLMLHSIPINANFYFLMKIEGRYFTYCITNNYLYTYQELDNKISNPDTIYSRCYKHALTRDELDYLRYGTPIVIDENKAELRMRMENIYRK